MFDKRWIIVNIVTNILAYCIGTVIAVIVGNSMIGVLVMITAFYCLLGKVYTLYDNYSDSPMLKFKASTSSRA